MAVGLVSLLPFVDPPMHGEPAAMTAMIWGITLVFAAAQLWILRCVWQRRHWARWVMVALAVFGIAAGVPVIADDWTRAPLVAWLGIASSVLGAVAVVLLLVAPSARWFKGAPTC
jgi:peptidoglycan/LPS O-acetylase OafA/YrhL